MPLKPLTEQAIIKNQELFGPAPVLNSENANDFALLLEGVTAALMPQDIIEQIYIRRFVTETWIIERLSRHTAVAIERRYHERLRYQQQRANFEKTNRIRSNSSLANATPTDIAVLAVLEENVTLLDTDVDEILTRKASERDHNLALERSIELQGQLDSLIASATRRRDDALTQLELYRAGLGAQAKEVANQILDGEFEEVGPMRLTATALVASDKQATDAGNMANGNADAR